MPYFVCGNCNQDNWVDDIEDNIECESCEEVLSKLSAAEVLDEDAVTPIKIKE